jgi:hypothetical protein
MEKKAVLESSLSLEGQEMTSCEQHGFVAHPWRMAAFASLGEPERNRVILC